MTESPLTQLALSLLTPLMSNLADPARAQAAARQAIEAYGDASPLAAAQIAGLAIASLDSLRLSMQADIPLKQKLKLRGNAASLTRQSQRTAALAATRRPAEAKPGLVDPNDKLEWAASMTRIAAELEAKAATASPEQRKADKRWIEALGNVARELRQPAPIVKTPPQKPTPAQSPSAALSQIARTNAA